MRFVLNRWLQLKQLARSAAVNRYNNRRKQDKTRRRQSEDSKQNNELRFLISIALVFLQQQKTFKQNVLPSPNAMARFFFAAATFATINVGCFWFAAFC